MPHVDISYSVDADAKNWVRIAKKRDTSFGISIEKERGFLGVVPGVDWSGPAEEIQPLVGEWLHKNTKLQGTFTSALSALVKRWSEVEETYFAALEKLTGRPICSDTFSAQLTTASLCPYDVRASWFMVDAFADTEHQVTVMAHEIFHLQFLRYFWDECVRLGLSAEQTDQLKESLTVLLNEPEFSSVITSPDIGYPAHQKLRRKLRELWRECPVFDIFLVNAADVVRNI